MKKKLSIPQFKNEDEERQFWARVDISRYFSAEDFIPASFPDLKPTSRSISVRIPEYILVRLKEQANELDIPYQTLMKQYIAKGVITDGTAVRRVYSHKEIVRERS